MLPSFATKTVTVERAPYADSRGTKVRDWSQAVPSQVGGCSFQPSSSSVSWTDASQAVTIRARLFLPPGTDVQAGDRIDVDGVLYAIDGAPEIWESPTGSVSHVVCNLIDWRL